MKSSWIVAALAALFLTVQSAMAQPTTSSLSVADAPTTTAAPQATTVTLESGVQYIDLAAGEGAEATTATQWLIHYTGRLESGKVFDASHQQVIPVPLAVDPESPRVIRGLFEGLQGMRVGGKRLVIVPSEHGYGKKGRPPQIPPDSTLYFEVELVALKQPPSTPQQDESQ